MTDFDQFGQTYDFPCYDRPANAYVICSTGRSGSHYLGHLFFSTGLLGSPLEYFHWAHLKKWRDILGASTELATVQGIVSRRTSPNGWWGTKTHWRQFKRMRALDIPSNILTVRHYVFIRRADILSQAISLVIAQQTNQWISFHTAPCREPVYSRHSISEAIDEIGKENANWNDFGATLSEDVQSNVLYEDLLTEPTEIVRRVARRIGARESAVIGTPRTERQATDRNENWKDRYLSGR